MGKIAAANTIPVYKYILMERIIISITGGCRSSLKTAANVKCECNRAHDAIQFGSIATKRAYVQTHFSFRFPINFYGEISFSGSLQQRSRKKIGALKSVYVRTICHFPVVIWTHLIRYWYSMMLLGNVDCDFILDFQSKFTNKSRKC